ncbi:hypothetical protein BKA83DRAFT_25294 [Pisolithus microcarpus]|nr:hypothetical protein BKA83DRAFT_25294 [Pisolithus microcarpus]
MFIAYVLDKIHQLHDMVPGSTDMGEYQGIDGSAAFHEQLGMMGAPGTSIMEVRWISHEQLTGGVAMEEKRIWDQDRNYGHTSHMSFSLATHLSCLDVQEWDNIPVHVIWQNNVVLFDRPDTDGDRQEVDMRDLDMVDKEGFEINVYNKPGYQVPQRVWNEAKFHVVQLGMVTSMFLGSGVQTASGQRGLEWEERRICKRVLCLLLKTWSHLSTMGAIKDSVQAFEPEINMFWKKYGLEAVNQWMINACTIEVVLMPEQMLNYGHTGNAAVLMNSWSIADGGHNGATGIMTSGSRDALTDDVVKAVTATDIWGSTLQDMDQGPQSWEVACYTGDVTFQVYFEDMKKLVHSRLSSKLTPQLGSPDFAKLMTSVLGKKPMTFIADVMIKQCSQAGNQNQPPFIKGGNFLQVAWVAIKEMGKAVTCSG